MFSGPTTGDPASIFWNPAAMTLLRGTETMVYGTVMLFHPSYQRDTPSGYGGSDFPAAQASIATFLPHLSAVTDLGLENWRFGLGVAIPLAQGVSWRESYAGQPSSTRYYAVEAAWIQVNLSPAVAYRINDKISVAAGLDIVGVYIEQQTKMDMGALVNQMICANLGSGGSCPLDAPLPREDAALDADLQVNGLGYGVGAFAGLLLDPLPWLRLGLGVHTGAGAVEVPSDVTLTIPQQVLEFVAANLPSYTVPPLEAELLVPRNSPWIVNAGVALRLGRRAELAADLHWLSTSQQQSSLAPVLFSSTGLITDQRLYNTKNDTLISGLRGQVRFGEGLTVGLRLQYDYNTYDEVYVTPTSFDFHMIKVQLGVSWRVRSWLTLQSEYSHQFVFGRDIGRSNYAPNAFPTTAEELSFDRPSPTGRYDLYTDRWGFGALLHF